MRVRQARLAAPVPRVWVYRDLLALLQALQEPPDLRALPQVKLAPQARLEGLPVKLDRPA